MLLVSDDVVIFFFVNLLFSLKDTLLIHCMLYLSVSFTFYETIPLFVSFLFFFSL